ncbi:MAG TPA: NAD(P)H-hydrate dehydratase, partial [Gemmatimonadaceae bacterium]|nr:NAD(P)H-hydrate dehydratase [Gemmatimonadaceae bacterium]
GAAKEIAEWGNVVLMGPGIGEGRRELVERVLRATRLPMVLDAEAITCFKGEPQALGALLGGRPAILTPHPAELASLLGASTSEVLVRRFEAAAEVARTTGAVVITKGTPTVITAPDGSRLVTGTGNAALAVAGSGDLLAGIAATLLAQREDDPHAAAACAAWAHGRAAELARGMRHTIRGITLEDVTRAISDVWEHWPEPLDGDVLAVLGAAGDAP